MKIIWLETISIEYSAHHGWLFVRIGDDDGSVGLGEASDSGDPERTAAIIRERIAPRLLGREPIPRLLPRLVHSGQIRFPSDLPSVTARSAAECALWDLSARSLEVPLARLLGGPLRERIPVYANVNRGVMDRTAAGFARQARQAREAGFTAIKCAPFDEVRPHMAPADFRDAFRVGVARIDAVRKEAGSEAALMVDCHGRFDRSTAAWAAGELDRFELTWLEEPVVWERDPGTFRAIKEVSRTPLAAGELLAEATSYRSLVSEGLVDIVMTDVKHCGGVGEVQAVGALCDAFSRPLSLHNPAGPVGTMISAHVTAATPAARILEYPFSPERDLIVRRMVEGEETVTASELRLPEGPGIGIDLRVEEIERLGRVARCDL